MRARLIAATIIAAALIGGFTTPSGFKSTEAGCAGSGCHALLPGFFELKTQDNLKIRVVPDPGMKKSSLGAELRDEQGRIMDLQETGAPSEMVLYAPRPGKYQILVGYRLKNLFWDSLWVDLAPSTVNIPTSRYGASTFQLFPLHPQTVKDGSLVRFILPNHADAELLLYSTTGKAVKTIFRGKLREGIHEIYWETRDDRRRPLPPGKYLCQLRSGRQMLVQPVFIRR